MRHVNKANSDLFDFLLGILIFLSNSIKFKLHLGVGQDFQARHYVLDHSPLHMDPWRTLDAFGVSDASHGGEKPMQCAILFIGGPTLVRIGRLASTSLSVTEGEWFAATTLAKLVNIAIPLVKFMNCDIPTPWFQFCDNDGACKLSESNISSRRMQHVASRLAYLQENVDDLIIALFHFISKGNIADIGTKVLGPRDFHAIRMFLVR